MKIYDHRNQDGALVSFETTNIGRSQACRVIEHTLSAANLRRHESDDFCTFELNGRAFIINEAWGDSSRYLIHEEPPGPSEELEKLKTVFERHRPQRVFSGSLAFRIFVTVLAAVLACIASAIAWLSRR